MRAGPKTMPDPEPLAFRSSACGSARFDRFCRKYIRVPKGVGARKPLYPRAWQLDLVGSILDADPQPRTAGWMLPRGQGKSSLVAALGLYDLFCGEEGATIVVAAVDERQAGIVFNIARRMVELDEELERRCQVFRDRLAIPATDSTFQCLTAEPKRLEGLDYSLAIVDEAGVVSRDVYEVLTLAQGKRPASTLIAIGTPGPDLDDSVLTDLRSYHLEHPDDGSLVWKEFSADEFQHHPVDCRHCWKLANPALGDFLAADAMTALLPPKTRESTFRRARLCQLIADSSGQFLTPECWDGLAVNGKRVRKGAEVVVALDGSFSDDTTALLVGTVSATPHFDVIGVWERPDRKAEDWRVPISEVEDAVRDACRRWRVLEVIADPFRWARTLQTLEAEGLPIMEFPHSPPRLTAATGGLYAAAVNGKLTHSGDRRLRAHVLAATVLEDARGIRISKRSRSRYAKKIDLAACLVMCYSRATWRATHRKSSRTRSFAS